MKLHVPITMLFILVARSATGGIIDPNFLQGFSFNTPWQLEPTGWSQADLGFSVQSDSYGRYANFDTNWVPGTGYVGFGGALSQRFSANAGERIAIWYRLELPETFLSPSPFGLLANLQIRQADDHGNLGVPLDVYRLGNPSPQTSLGWTEFDFDAPASASYYLRFELNFGASPGTLASFSATSDLRFNNPVPEPSAVILALSGIVAVAVREWRRRALFAY